MARRLTSDDLREYDRRPDGFNAVRLIMAISDDDADEVGRVLREAETVALVVGLAAVALALGERAAGEDPTKLRLVLDHVALNPSLDRADTADAYRKRVAP